MSTSLRATEQLTLFDDNGLIYSKGGLVSVAIALGAAEVHGWSRLEERLAATRQNGVHVSRASLLLIRRCILAGQDPLGEAFSRIRSAEERRPLGATYTPPPIVTLMLDWAAEYASSKGSDPARVVDPGVGSARFLVAAGRRFPQAELVGIDIDPLAALIARANLAAAGLASRSSVLLSDYRSTVLGDAAGATLYVGNPPYVRHHLISADWKEWLVEKAKSVNLTASQLAGLHVYFFLATALRAKLGDFGVFITAAEWLDVNYGKLVRDLFLGSLGGRDIMVLEPTARAFPDAATTAAIATFVPGEPTQAIHLSRVETLETTGNIGEGTEIRRERLAAESRWSHLSRPTRERREHFVELGELCRVHRGSVTGANKVWIAAEHSGLLPRRVLFRTITRARELFLAGSTLSDTSALRFVIDIPVELDELAVDDRRLVDRFLRKARELGAHLGYVARTRKAWWAVGLRKAPPIMATYMARRPPAFVRNAAGARYINIAHGLYPRETLSELALQNLAHYLSTATSISDGRTYAGGLTKFEPREMERLLVPEPALLTERVFG